MRPDSCNPAKDLSLGIREYKLSGTAVDRICIDNTDPAHCFVEKSPRVRALAARNHNPGSWHHVQSKSIGTEPRNKLSRYAA